MSKERNSAKWGTGAGVAAGNGVEDNNVWVGNLVEQLVGIVHGGGSWVGSAEIDELGEDRNVILEMGFDGKGLDLLQLSQRRDLGYERDRVFCVGFWVGKWAHLDRRRCHNYLLMQIGSDKKNVEF